MLLCKKGMILFIIGLLSSHWDNSLHIGMIISKMGVILVIMGCCSSNGMILFIIGGLSSHWDNSLYSGMIVSKMG